MIGVLGATQQPIDFTMSGCQNVLDLRKIRVKDEESLVDSSERRHNENVSCIMPQVTTYTNPNGLHRYSFSGHQPGYSSEDGSSERGSVSPPFMSPPTPISAPFSITGNIISGGMTRSGKPTRPFKAYPKNPLALLPVVSSAETILGHASNEAYAEFRRKMLSQVHAVSGGNATNPKMKRSTSPLQTPTSCGEEGKDAAYWERRKKNNEAAKRSRDARRAKEDEMAIRAAFLEQENIQLKYENINLRNEAAKLRCLLYNR